MFFIDVFIEILSLDPDIYQGVMTPDPDSNHCLPLSCIFKVKMYSSFFVLSFLS